MSKEDFQRQLNSIHQEIAFLVKPFMNHRNIVKMVAWGLCLDTLEDTSSTEPVVPYLVLERAYSNLQQAMESTTSFPSLDWNHGLREICLDVGRGLQAIHSAGLIHGDLKLPNILLFLEKAKNGRQVFVAKLCDFGSSRNDTENTEEKHKAAMAGTPRWQPPEESTRLKDGSLQVTDVYSFGWVVWCCATLEVQPLPWRPPHHSSPPSSLYDSLETGQPFDPDDVYKRAKKVLSEKYEANGPMFEDRRILRVLLRCLHEDERLWDPEPWWLLDTKRYPLVRVIGEDPTALSDLAKQLSRFSHTILIKLAGTISANSGSILTAAQVNLRRFSRDMTHR